MHERLHGHGGHEGPECASECAEHQTFGENLAYDPPAARAQSEAQGELAGASGSSHEEQIRDVHHGDQEDERNRAEEHEQGCARVAQEGGPHRLERDARAVVDRGVRIPEPSGDPVHLGLGDVHRDAVRKPPDNREPERSTRLSERGVRAIEELRDPEIGVARVALPLPCHPDDLPGLVVQDDRPPHDRRIAAEPAGPQLVAEHGHAHEVALRLLVPERPAEGERGTEHVEEPTGHGGARYKLGVALPGERPLVGPDRHHGRHRRALLPPVGEPRPRGDVLLVPLRRVAHPNGDQPVGLGVGERREHDAPHDAEDRRCRPDSQGERQQRRKGEARAARQAPESEAYVADNVLEPTGPSRPPGFLAIAVLAAERDQGASARLAARQPLPHEGLGLHVDVEPQLLIDVALRRAHPERAQDPQDDPSHHPPSGRSGLSSHDVSPSTFNRKGMMRRLPVEDQGGSYAGSPSGVLVQAMSPPRYLQPFRGLTAPLCLPTLLLIP